MVTKRRVIIVDDEPLARDELNYMLKSQHLDFEVVGSVDNTAKAWELIQNNAQIEGVFLDINIETENKRAGLDFALNLNRLAIKPWIIFITGYREYSVEAFDAFPVHYLVKPVNNLSMERTLNWVRTHCHQRQKPSTKLTIRHRITDMFGEKIFPTEYIEPDEIIYIQKNNGVNNVKIGLINGDILDGINDSLKDWENRGFFRIHRRNLVNLKHVRREMPRIGENSVYKIAFKNCSIELDIGPDFSSGLHDELKKL